MHRKKEIATLIFVMFTMLVGFPSWLVYREVRHERLNEKLVEDLQAYRFEDALSVMHEGADGAAPMIETEFPQPNGNTYVTLGVSEDIGSQGLLERLTHLFLRRSPSNKHKTNRYSALCVLYACCDFDERHKPGQHGSHSTVETLALALLKAGSGTEDNYFKRGTPLELAAKYHHHTVVSALLDTSPRLAANAAVALANADPVDSETLLRHGVKLEAADWDGSTAVFHADAAKLRLLISRGAKINLEDQFGKTPLGAACERGDDAAADVLLKHGALANPAESEESGTPMFNAAQYCHLETVKKLAAAGADIHYRNSSRHTTLMLATWNPDIRVFEWLLQRGIGVNLRADGGDTALTMAIYGAHNFSSGYIDKRFSTIIHLLRRHGAKR